MEAIWVLLLIFQTADGITTEKIPFNSRVLCTGAKDFLVQNIEPRDTRREPKQIVQGFCIQTRRNTP